MAALYAAMSFADDSTSTSPVAPAAPSNAYDERAPKKPRTHQACEICRERKTKCTGERPACAQCIKRGIPCSYDRKPTPRRSDGLLQLPRQNPPPQASLMSNQNTAIDRPYRPRTTVDDIIIVDAHNQNRFRQYQLELQDQPDPRGIKRPHESEPPVRAPSDIRPRSENIAPRVITSPEIRDPKRTISSAPHDINGTRPILSPEARVTTAAPAPRPQQTPTPAPEENGVYGLSSNVGFINKISGEETKDVPPSTVLGEKRARSVRPKFRLPERLSVSDTSGSDLLPRRNRADDFVRCYWDFMHPLFPLLHKESFVLKYQQLWESDIEDTSTEFEENMFMSALHLVFAIGCRFSPLIPNDQKMSLSETFYQRSRQTFGYDILDTNSLSMIQLLLLQVVYLSSTHHAIRCWNAIGLAVRASQSVGLHLDDADEKSRPGHLQVEMRRRIWHTCVTLDRLVAMVFGRPATVQTIDSPLPSLIDDEFIGARAPGRQPEGRLPALGLFVHSIKLFDVLQDVLISLYASNSQTTSELRLQVPGSKDNDNGQLYDMVGSVMSFARRIDAVEKDIPVWLLAEPTDRTESHVRLQQRVLRVRLGYVRLIALRPLLLYAPQRDRGARTQTLEDDIVSICCQRCVETSKTLINYTFSNLSDLHRSAPWHTTIYTCAALSVFLAALKLGQVAWDDAELHKSWDAAIAILESYQDQVAAAAEGINVLQTLKRKLLSSLKRTQEGGHDPTYSTPLSLQDLSGVNLGFDDINDAWFSQHFLDTNWLELPAV